MENSAHLAPANMDWDRSYYTDSRIPSSSCPFLAAFQRSPNFAGKLLQRIRLLQKVRFEVQNIVVEHRLARIPGHEQKLDSRKHLYNFPGKFAPTHIGHHDI